MNKLAAFGGTAAVELADLVDGHDVRVRKTGGRFGFRYAWPSGRWGSLPLEGGIEAAYRAEIDAHGKESLNFQLSMLIYDAVAAVLCFVLIGIPILILLWIMNTIFVIIASLQASDGKLYRYPLTIRFLT